MSARDVAQRGSPWLEDYSPAILKTLYIQHRYSREGGNPEGWQRVANDLHNSSNQAHFHTFVCRRQPGCALQFNLDAGSPPAKSAEL